MFGDWDCIQFSLLTTSNALIWFYSLKYISVLKRSTLHALIALFFSILYPKSSSIFIASISSGYFLSDLSETKQLIYTFHHILGVGAMWILTQKPYSLYNIMPKIMLVEASTPYLNIYLHNKTPANCFIYLLTHIYFRNIRLVVLYTRYLPLLMKDGIHTVETISVMLFIFLNFYWTVRTLNVFRKLIF
jgi:hypothetical protein